MSTAPLLQEGTLALLLPAPPSEDFSECPICCHGNSHIISNPRIHDGENACGNEFTPMKSTDVTLPSLLGDLRAMARELGCFPSQGRTPSLFNGQGIPRRNSFHCSEIKPRRNVRDLKGGGQKHPPSSRRTKGLRPGVRMPHSAFFHMTIP